MIAHSRYKFLDAKSHHPGSVVVGWFAVLIVIGTGLLAMPLSHSAAAIGLSDCFFTAASAVTVTGLTVVDTGTSWSPFGEFVLMALIQIGGLGVMTLAGFTAIAINRRLGLRTAMLAGAEIGLDDFGMLRRLIKDLVAFVVLAEVSIALVLTARFFFGGDHQLWKALHLGLFHSISAFNNAGFSVQENGLVGHGSDWLVSLVIAAGFIVGGIGFPVAFELKHRWRTPIRWTLHTKVTLSTTVFLLIIGMLLFAMTEWTNPASLKPLSFADKWLASFFQSATTRTAGFNTVAIDSLRDSTLLVMLPLMAIGASSASTGGGIKTSTFALVTKSTISEFRRDRRVVLFDRHPPIELQRQALALVVAALATIGTSTFILVAAHSEIAVIDLLFEAASAFATVGLSTGVTGELDQFTRLLVVVLMFIGRVGPITFGTAFLLRDNPRRFGHAEESMLIG